MPTLVEAAGGEIAKGQFDGSSFLPVLEGKKSGHRRFVYGVHNNIPEGPAYPIRTVSNGRFRYIRNLSSDEIYIEKHLMGIRGNGKLNNPYWSTWVRDSWKSERTYALVKRYMRRPPEELYETTVDRFELKNVIGDEKHAAILKQLRSELDRWLEAQGDPGLPQDTHEAHQAAREGRHLYGVGVGG